MSRAHNVVNKLQGLIDKSNDCTKKHDTDLHGAIDSLIEGFGKGEGGSGIINVIELPTENIDENAIYKKAELEIYLVEPGYPVYTFKEIMYEWGSYMNAAVTIVKVDKLPETMTPTNLEPDDGENLHAYIYITENDGIAYIYPVSTYEDMPSGIMTVGEFIWGYEDKGWTEDVNSETETGIYCGPSNKKITHYLQKDGNWVELVSEEHVPIIKPLTITKGGVYEATHLNYDTEVKFKDVITEADFKAYIANACITGDDGERIFYALADSIAVVQWEISDSVSTYAIMDDQSGIGYMLNGAIMGEGISDGWQSMNSGEPVDAPVITIPSGAYMSADLATTTVFFDVEKIDAYCPIIVDVAAPTPTLPIIKPLTITENGVYEATEGGSLGYDTEVKFKDIITEADFKSYIANAELMSSDDGRNLYILANAIAVMHMEIPEAPSVYAIMDQQSGIGYMLNGFVMNEGMSDGWQSMSSGEPVDAPVITIPSGAQMSADLATTAVFFDIEEKIDAYCPIIVDVAAPALTTLNITKNGTYEQFKTEGIELGGGYIFKDSYTEDELITLYENGEPDWGAESAYTNSSSKLIEADFNLSIRNINDVHFIEYYAYDDSFGFVYATETAATSGVIEQITEPGWFDRNDLVKVDTPSIILPSDPYFIVDLNVLTPMLKPIDGWNKVTVAVWPVVRDITIRKNGVYNPPMDVNGFSKVTVDVEPTVSKITITKNGVYTPSADIDGYSEVVVDVIGGGDADKYFEGGHSDILLPNATKIRDYAFYYDTTLQNVEMPNVTDIGKYAFSGCSKLALTKLPEGLTSISSGTFSGCSRLALTKLPEGLTSIGASAFRQSNLALTELPEGLTSIDSSAFESCSGLTTLTFKGTPTSIGSSAFRYCYSLTTINVPWAEGEVKYAPWEAPNATINYNYTGEAAE